LGLLKGVCGHVINFYQFSNVSVHRFLCNHMVRNWMYSWTMQCYRLPYLEATITEISRISTIAPMSVPHATTRDTELGGYNIKKVIYVVIMLPVICMVKKTKLCGLSPRANYTDWRTAACRRS
jgi:hypothetical protein